MRDIAKTHQSRASLNVTTPYWFDCIGPLSRRSWEAQFRQTNRNIDDDLFRLAEATD